MINPLCYVYNTRGDHRNVFVDFLGLSLLIAPLHVCDTISF